MNKKKIINDPVHGFIRIPSELIFDLIEHPVFQRLRRIKQLGLSYFVYPGATHTRFQHAIGAVHLMSQAISHLQMKNAGISPEEEEAVLIAILLHDIGHGPFSHALENSIINGISHEDLSDYLMHELNREFGDKLDLAIQIFNNKYHKKFLHQLVSGQLDMDRMDYLKRDSFYTGVVEGNIGVDRLIKMLDVRNDILCIEAKGIYSIENFLIARRLMYWQVYYHKTVIASEFMLVKTLQRARYLAQQGEKLFATPPLEFFLYNNITPNVLKENPASVIPHFLDLDDSDIMVSAKQWSKHNDKVLQILANGIINRKLVKVEISKIEFDPPKIDEIIGLISKKEKLSAADVSFLVSTDCIANWAYTDKSETIKISFSDGTVKEIAQVSDVLNISYLNEMVMKYYLCYPKDCGV